MNYLENNQFKKTIYYYTWGEPFPLIPRLIDDIEKLNPKRIIFCDFEEYEYPWNYPELVDELNELIKKYNIEFIIALGSEETDFYSVSFSSKIKSKKLYFPFFWLYKTYSHLDTNLKNEKIKIYKLFISLNNFRRYHRYILMDKLCENNLIDYGNISWHQYSNGINYDWICWDEKKLIIDKFRNVDDKFGSWEDQFNVPSEYKQSFVNLVTETTTETIFLTEKTFMTILLQQPFLILGGTNIHNFLRNYGFRLYDEIFDYSFDSLEKVEDRIDGIIKNLLKIKDENYTNLRKLIEDKIQFNFNHAINIVENKLFIPNEIKEILNELNFNFQKGIGAKCLQGSLFQGYQKQKNINKII